MKKKLYLHIGMGKTGTTALQDFFWENRKVLGKMDICYPKWGTMSNAHHLLSPHVPAFLQGIWRFQEVETWAPKLSKKPQSRILLSSELMAWASVEEARDFCTRISEWFDAYVVIYLRRQDNIMMASYNQQIKAGTQKRRIDLIFRSRIENFNYPRVLAPWSEVLGQEKIIVRPYEQGQFYQDDVRRDFMHSVFDIDIDQRFVLGTGDSNPRLSLAAGEYKRLVNNLVNDEDTHNRFNELLLQYSLEHSQSAPGDYTEQTALSPQQRLEVIDASREACRLIATEYLGREDGQLFYEPEPEPEDPWMGLELSSEESAAITSYIRARDPSLVEGLGQKIHDYKDSLAYQIRHAARFLSGSVHPPEDVLPIYHLAACDTAPIVIGGLGGSGTRLVVSLLRKMGVVFGGEKNESLDNLWFSLLFVRRSILLKSDDEIEKLVWLFTNAMRHGVDVNTELRNMLDEACACDRSPMLPTELLAKAAESLLVAPAIDRLHKHWGWKEPNSHILFPMLDRYYPRMKYIHVVRNGLDMAFSENQNQFKYLWGDLLLEGDCSPTPRNALRYWVAAHRRMMGFRQRAGERLHFLSFDRLCADPEGELVALREFVGLSVDQSKVIDIAANVTPPESSGRFRQHDMAQFDPDDLEFVRQMGFEVA